MSRFYATIDGAARTQATRRGHSFITTHAASWSGAVRVHLYLDSGGNECFQVDRVPWKGHGPTQALAAGFLTDPKGGTE